MIEHVVLEQLVHYFLATPKNKTPYHWGFLNFF